jgi:hypothetical protein
MNASQGGLSFKNPSYTIEGKLPVFLVRFMYVILAVTPPDLTLSKSCKRISGLNSV